MTDREKVIQALDCCLDKVRPGAWASECIACPYAEEEKCRDMMILDALALLKEQEHKDKMFHALEDDWKRLKELLKEQEARIQKYEYVFGFLGIGFRQWTTKILNGEAEAICETDEHEHKTVVTFKLI